MCRTGRLERGPTERIPIGAGVERAAQLWNADRRAGAPRRARVREGAEEHFHFAAAQRAEQAEANGRQPQEGADDAGVVGILPQERQQVRRCFHRSQGSSLFIQFSIVLY